jgi:tRNA1Val (adenine37-N6)-methyltransferase
MKNSPERRFTFKQFSLSDSRCAMKIGTDGVLLGSYASHFQASRVLDIGTGCGLIALMIAQQTHAIIDAVEIDKDACEQADENFHNSPWKNRLAAYNLALQDFIPINNKKYDLIVCNPPFFQNSLPSQTPQKTIARHNHSLSFDDIFSFSAKWLCTGGILLLIFPADLDGHVTEIAGKNSLFATEKLFIIPRTGDNPKRVISGFKTYAEGQQLMQNSMHIESEIRHQYTQEYRDLTCAFHPFF